ncbi:hypothetical protein CAEBREN_24576 [Caenorhabditis brenneri]|uniref:Uncharacterized protein n=1 Tax=Caenorhabditis brenneri TaxID=135651 RepID=G0PHB3_CAEBE|nr:hypothetical protein CAEBREN_24576 [Caenorhabditis brenneri]
MCRLPASLYNPGNYQDQLGIEDVTRNLFGFGEEFVVVVLEPVEIAEDGGVQREMIENREDEGDVSEEDETDLDDAEGLDAAHMEVDIQNGEDPYDGDVEESDSDDEEDRDGRMERLEREYGQLHINVDFSDEE